MNGGTIVIKTKNSLTRFLVDEFLHIFFQEESDRDEFAEETETTIVLLTKTNQAQTIEVCIDIPIGQEMVLLKQLEHNLINGGGFIYI